MEIPARQLPAGYAASGWASLGELGRGLFLEEILAMSSDYFVDGTVNYQDSREPIMTNRTTGNYQTLRGENIPWEDLSLELTIYKAPKNNLGLWFLAAAGAILLVGMR